jgi:hypothetical protein
MNKLLFLLLSFLISSCSTFKERDKKRELQSEIIRALTTKTEDLGQCAKKFNLYDNFNTESIRVELNLTLNAKGQVEKFQLDEQNYPEKFADCMFNVVDLIAFPSLKKDEVIELTQPMIFRKN